VAAVRASGCQKQYFNTNKKADSTGKGKGVKNCRKKFKVGREETKGTGEKGAAEDQRVHFRGRWIQKGGNVKKRNSA